MINRADAPHFGQFMAALTLIFAVHGPARATANPQEDKVSACEESARRSDKLIDAYLGLSAVGLKVKAINAEDLQWAEAQPSPVIPARHETNLNSSSLKTGFNYLIWQLNPAQWKETTHRLSALRKKWSENSQLVDDTKLVTEPIFLWKPTDFHVNGLSTAQLATSDGQVFFTTHLDPQFIHEIRDESQDEANNREEVKKDSSDFYETKAGEGFLATLIDRKTLVVIESRTKKKILSFDVGNITSIRPSAVPPMFYKPILFESPGTDFASKGRLMVALVSQGGRIFVENSNTFPMALVDVSSGNFHEFTFPTGNFFFDRLEDGRVYAYGFGPDELKDGVWGSPIMIAELSSYREIIKKFYKGRPGTSFIPTLALDDADQPKLYVRDSKDVRKYDSRTNEFLLIKGFEGARLPLFIKDKFKRRTAFSFATSIAGNVEIILQPVDGSQEAIRRESPLDGKNPVVSVGVVETPNGNQVFLGSSDLTQAMIYIYDVNSDSFFSLGSVPTTVHRISALFYSARDNRIYALTYNKKGRLFVTHLAQVWGPADEPPPRD